MQHVLVGLVSRSVVRIHAAAVENRGIGARRDSRTSVNAKWRNLVERTGQRSCVGSHREPACDARRLRVRIPSSRSCPVLPPQRREFSAAWRRRSARLDSGGSCWRNRDRDLARRCDCGVTMRPGRRLLPRGGGPARRWPAGCARRPRRDIRKHAASSADHALLHFSEGHGWPVTGSRCGRTW